MEKLSICVVGSGNWGTSVGKILAKNALGIERVENEVHIYVSDEIFDGKRISKAVNRELVNVKYLKNSELPENLIPHTDLIEAAKYADIIVFVMPAEFLVPFCKTLLGKIKPSTSAISLIKGFKTMEEGGIELFSETVMKILKIPCSILMGVNLVSEIALNMYCEATLGCRDLKYSKLYHDLFALPNFRVTVIDDADCVEVLGYMKHLVAFATGILDGLECNQNAKSALIRFSLNELIRYFDIFYPGCKLSTLFESCGIADILTVCAKSRNRNFAEKFVKSEKSLNEMENLHGDVIWGPLTAKEVTFMLQHKGVEKHFPIFTTVHKICLGSEKPVALIDAISNIPNIIYNPTHLFPI